MNKNKGNLAEKVISEFFDTEFSQYLSFPNPKTQIMKAEVADVLIWLNRIVLLVEVKAKTKGTSPIGSWVRNRIKRAVEQITRNYKRIENHEKINLHNKYFHTFLDTEGLSTVIGLIILVYEETCEIKPSSVVPDIYQREIPIHVLSWNDLKKMTKEIDTIPDLVYYLNDRYNYLKISDISLEAELNALGYYKSQRYRFPIEPVEFSESRLWNQYIKLMSNEISRRTGHNEFSVFIDKLVDVFSDTRRLFHEIPLGLYFIWELSLLSRRERAHLGEYTYKVVQEDFERGKSSTKVSTKNEATGNWHLFYFAFDEQEELYRNLEKLVRQKLMVEIDQNDFDFAVYGFGFKVSRIYPHKLLGPAKAIGIGADEIKGKFTKNDLDEAYKNFNGEKGGKIFQIKEFPNDL